MDQPVHSELDAHDRYQLEFKYDYELLAHKKTRYRIVTYIFLPQSLGINAYTYPPDEFYRSLQNYVRLKTPVFSLQELAEKPGSPLNRAQRILDDPDWLQHPNGGGLLITNFKFLRAILKDALDDCLETLALESDNSPRELADEVVKQEIVASISVRHIGRFLKGGHLKAASQSLLAEQRTGAGQSGI